MTHPIWILLLIILLFLGIFTVLLMAAVVKNPPKKPTEGQSKNLPDISVIIPFRNEERRLPDLFDSLSRQEYPGNWNVILVNDRSTDNSVGIIEDFCRSYPRLPLCLIHSTYDASIELTGKQQALETGVSRAPYDWLAFTDADVQLSPQWLSSLSNRIRSGAEFAYGHTAILTAEKSIFAQFQKFQLRFLFCTAYAFSRARLSGSCMGNNLCVSKSLYKRIGGQHGIGYSIVEDRELFNRATRLGNPPKPTLPFHPTVYTYPEPTVRSFYAQARRWALGGIRGSKLLFLVMMSLAIQNIVFLSVFFGLEIPLVTGISIINMILLWLFAILSFAGTGDIRQAFLFPVFYGMMIIESIFLTAGFLFSRRIHWKGEVLKST